MKRFLLYLILLITLGTDLYGQSYPVAIFNDPSLNKNLRVRSSTDYSNNSNVIDAIIPSNKLVASSYNNGWVVVSIPSPQQNVQTSGYVFVGCQDALFDYSSGYVTVQNTFSSGLNMRPKAGDLIDHVTISNNGTAGRTITGNALGWDGQQFACTGNVYPSSSNPQWYQIYLTSDCSQSTGWVSAQYVTYTPPSSSGNITSSNSSQNVPASATSCSFNISSNTTYCVSVESSTLQGLTVTTSMNNPLDPTSGIGNGTINCSFSANASNAPQSATILLSEDGGTNASLTLTINQATATPTCSYTVSPSTGTSFTSSGGSGTINVTAGSSCNWTVSNLPNWISVSSNSGTGSGTITYTVASNNSTNPLSGNITIQGQSIPISEAANTPTTNPAISLSGTLSFGNVSIGSTSTSPFTIYNTGNAPLTVSSINYYPSNFSGAWNGTIPAGQSQPVNVTFSPSAATSYSGTITVNSNATSGTGTINCSGTGTQASAPLSASFTLSQTTVAQGGSITATSTSTGNPTSYSWTSSPSSGITFSNPTSASTNITFANTGTYNIGLGVGNGNSTSQAPAQTVTVTSSNNSCTYSLTPTGNTNYSASGGSGSINVTAGSNCPWSAITNVSWISLQNTGGTGNGTVNYTVRQNTTSNPLSGNITVEGQSIAITEAASGTQQSGTSPIAAFALSSSSIAQGGTVSTTNNSTGSPATYLWWTSAPKGDAVFSPGSGTSSAQAPSITFNTAGTFTVYLMATNAMGSNEAQQTITVTATPGCSYTLTPNLNASVPATGGTYSITVNTATGSNCSWRASSSSDPWITINSGNTGTGSGTISYTIAANPGNNSRKGNISVGGQSFAITQAGVNNSSYSISITSATIPASVEEGSSFSGSITVDLSKAGPKATWHIEADAFDQDNSYVGDIIIGQGTSNNSISFSSRDVQQYIIAGYHFNWNAVLESNNTSVTDPQQTTITEQQTISITSSVIPPWQREGEGFTGQITVDRSNTGQNATWHIEADGFDQNNKYLGDVIIGEGTSGNTIKFSYSDVHEFGLTGDHINWSAVLESNNAHQTAPVQTQIIDPMWNQKNIVYFNDGNHSLNIPLKYIPNCYSVTVSFSRVPETSTQSDDIESKNNQGQLSSNFNIPIYGSIIGYPTSSSPNDIVILNNSNSNLKTIAPGVFSYSISYYSSQGTQLFTEGGKFELTKIGNVNSVFDKAHQLTSFNPNKVVILIAGLNDNIENYIQSLPDLASQDEINNSEWSIAYALVNNNLAPGNTNYNTWYIATSNLNRIQGNAYDIGTSIDSILSIIKMPPFNSSQPDLSIISHSKGCIETDIMMDGMGIPLSSQSGFGLNSSIYYKPNNIVPYLHSIIFLGAPHGGFNEFDAEVMDKISNVPRFSAIHQPIYLDFYSEGVQDLFPSSEVMKYLNKKNGITIPSNVRIGNITGYGDPYGDLALVQSLFTFVKELPANYLPLLNELPTNPISAGSLLSYPGDGAVSVPSSQSIDQDINNNHQIFQYYIKDDIKDNILKMNILHTYLNRLYTLTDINDACENVSLLDRIIAIINNENIQRSCPEPSIYQFYVALTGSSLSNATININDSSNIYSPIAKTDENGIANFYFYDSIPIGDTLLISSPGIIPLKFTIDSTIANKQSFDVAMFHNNDSVHISEPRITLIKQGPITSTPDVKLNVTANNAIQYQINSPLGQDSIFVPLSLNNNQITVHLDTGVNFITVRFIGKQDTVTLTKLVSYLPDSLMNAWTNNLHINASENLIGAKVFVNNQFYQNITSANTDLKILAGYSEVKFSRFGYRDTTFTINTDSSIELSMLPYSYSSTTDSSSINFSNGLNPQYWKNITAMEIDTPATGNISLKQYDDSFPNTGLQPETRKFVFHNLSSQPVRLKAAMALDQANTPDSSDVYLLAVHNGIYTKYQANIPNLTEYDPEVQKIEFDSVQITPGGTEQLVLMKKLAPIMPSQTLKYPSGIPEKIPLSLFAQNPDSIPHDMQVTARIINSPAGMETYLDSNSLRVISAPGDSGDITLQVTATHDFIPMTKDYDIKIAPPTLTKDNMILYPNPASDNLNIVVEVANKFQLTSLTIYNVWGQVIKNVVNDHPLYKGYHVFTVPLGYLPAGIYFVEWRGVMTKKFIKYSESGGRGNG